MAVFLVLVMHQGNVLACFPEGITMNFQSDVDNFLLDNPDCTEIEGDLVLYIDPLIGGDISDLKPLSNITHIGGDLQIYYCIQLVALTGLNNVSEIGGNLEIYHTGITNLKGLDRLEVIGGTIWMEDNPFLEGIKGALNLTTIGNDLILVLNPMLQDLNGLDQLSYLGGNLEIYENNSFEMPGSFGQLTHVGGDIYIAKNPAMSSLQGMEHIQKIGGSLDISFNPRLVSLMPLSGITSLGNDLEVYCNDTLESLAGLDHITSVKGSVNIACLDRLESFKGLNALELVIGNLTVQDNEILKDFSGLNALETIAGQIKVWSNASLKDFSGLENLKHTGGYLKIHDNPVLSGLTGLDNIDPGDFQYLYLVDNDSLSYCTVESICRFFYNPHGTVVINGNREGCNSNLEITERCEGQYPDPVVIPEDYLLYPNPASNTAYLVPGTDRTIGNLQVFNPIGQRILKLALPPSELDISRYPAGIYTLRFDLDGSNQVTRLVVR